MNQLALEMESLAYQNDYVSCIKMNGVPLLPPFMTQEYRQEMQYYKKLAIAVEQRISEMKACLDDSTVCSNNIVSDTEECFDDINLSLDINLESDRVTIPNDESESTKCDNTNCNNYPDDLNSEAATIIDFSSENIPKQCVQEEKCVNELSEKIKKHDLENLPIACEDVKDGSVTVQSTTPKFGLVKEFHSPIIINRTYTKEKTVSVTKTKKTPPSNYKLSPSKNVTGSLNDISSGLSSPPKLVRQNSYTLDSPSPLLLAHLESQSQSSGIRVDSISMSESAKVDKNHSNEKNNVGPKLDIEEIVPSITATPIKRHHHFNDSANKSLTKPSVKRNLFTGDSYKNKPTENMNNQNISSSNSTNEAKIDNSLSDLSESDLYINMIMKKMKDDQEKQMMTLIKSQQEEQERLRKIFANQQDTLLTQFKTAINNAKKTNSKNSTPENKPKISSKSSIPIQKDTVNKNSIENTEKYLIISSDVLNESRSLLTNRKQVKLSPTDIQCLNIAPNKTSDENKKYFTAEKDGYDHLSSKSNKSLNQSNIGSAYYLSDNNMNSSDNTSHDDLNLSFCSEDGSHTNKLYENNRNSIFKSLDEKEKAMKLKKALSKISEIQKNLASQTLAMEKRSLHSDIDSMDDSQNISLSSIDYMPNYVSDYNSQKQIHDRNCLSLDLVDINKPAKNKIVKSPKQILIEKNAANLIVAHCKGYLVRRLMKTERVQMIVQTIKDTLLCALQLHRDEGGIQGPDIELHRRLIQQITAACYALNEIFVQYSVGERMAIIAQDREKKLTMSYRMNGSPNKQLSATTKRILKRRMEGMSKSHSGAFTSKSRIMNNNYNSMTRSYYGGLHQSDSARSSANEKSRRNFLSNDPNRKPWR